MSIVSVVASFVGDHLPVIPFFIVVLLLTCHYILSSNDRLPPGPKGIPWFGFALRHAGSIQDIQSWQRSYGNLVSVRFNGRPSIVISDIKHIKDVLGNHANHVSDRIPDHPFMRYFDYKGGIGFNSGPSWREQRRFALRSMRDFGMGKLSMEGRIQDEAQEFVDEMEKHCGQTLDLQYLLAKAVSNVMNTIVFGQRFEYEDQVFLRSISEINQVAQFLPSVFLVNTVPILRLFPSKIRSEYYQWYKSLDTVVSWIKPQLDEHREKFDPDNIRDFIDTYLLAAKDLSDSGDCKTSLTDENITAVIFDLFLAGTETTSSTLRWALLMMAMYPDIQRKVQAEIDSVVPKGRLPSLQDRSNLVYTEAAMCEIFRWAPILPFALAHAVSETFDYQGYTFPKKSLLLYNIWGVHRNPEIWNEPNRFNPGRFLDATGEMNKSLTEHLIPFGVGRRICLGEGLARMEFYLFFSALMQKFSFELPTDLQLPDFATYQPTGLYRPPDDYKLMVTTRTK